MASMMLILIVKAVDKIVEEFRSTRRFLLGIIRPLVMKA